MGDRLATIDIIFWTFFTSMLWITSKI